MVRKSKSRVKAPAARTDREVLLNRWGIKIDPELLELALTHRSWAHEQGGLPTNERLEFLGDSVLGLVVTEELYTRFPGVSEGQLAKMRSATVSEPALAQIAQQLGLGEFILLGNGEAITGGREKASILSDTVEAMIGATYLTHGFNATRPVVQVLVSGFLNRAQVRGGAMDWKTSLLELCNAHGLGAPNYEVEGFGPDHSRRFRACARLGDHELGSGEGSSKKAAELVAAESAYARLLAEKGDAGLALPGVNEALAADQAHGSLLGGVPANATDD